MTKSLYNRLVQNDILMIVVIIIIIIRFLQIQLYVHTL